MPMLYTYLIWGVLLVLLSGLVLVVTCNKEMLRMRLGTALLREFDNNCSIFVIYTSIAIGRPGHNKG